MHDSSRRALARTATAHESTAPCLTPKRPQRPPAPHRPDHRRRRRPRAGPSRSASPPRLPRRGGRHRRRRRRADRQAGPRSGGARSRGLRRRRHRVAPPRPLAAKAAQTSATASIDVCSTTPPSTPRSPAARSRTSTRHEWDRVMKVNLKGPWLVTRAASPYLPEGGRVINLSSPRSSAARSSGCTTSPPRAAWSP